MEQPSYYSITPAVVRYDNDLKPNEKLLYGEITALSNKYGYCTASNGYFSKLYDAKKETVSRWISNLNRKGYIKVKIIRDDSKIVKQRRIYVSDIGEVLTKKSIGYGKKNQYPIDKKVKENNTSINNTSINISSSNKKQEQDSNKEIDPFIRYFEGTLFIQTTAAQRNRLRSLLKAIPYGVREETVQSIVQGMPVKLQDPVAYFAKSLINAKKELHDA